MKTLLISVFCVAVLAAYGQQTKASSDTTKADTTKTEFTPLTLHPNFSSPLFIVDDIEVAEQDIALINANDIEVVTILKDSASISLYGEKAKFGVVKIELKKKPELRQKNRGQSRPLLNYKFQIPPLLLRRTS
jgi:hypothetical protein